jgi:hypothetical protein
LEEAMDLSQDRLRNEWMNEWPRYMQNCAFNLDSTSDCMLHTGKPSFMSKVPFALSKAGTIRLTQGMGF